MTAPDPGLIDLIAAHQLVSTDTIFHRNGMVQRPECKCGELMHWAGAYPAHLALVVEQHTNGRIAELEATVARVEKAVNTAAAHRFDFDNTSIEGLGGKVGGPNNFFNGNRYVTNYVRAALEGKS